MDRDCPRIAADVKKRKRGVGGRLLPWMKRDGELESPTGTPGDQGPKHGFNDQAVGHWIPDILSSTVFPEFPLHFVIVAHPEAPPRPPKLV